MLKVYLISSIISIVVSTISLQALANKVKREGYIILKEKSSLAEKMKLIILFFIPIFNILLMLISLFGDELIINNLKERNLIKKES